MTEFIRKDLIKDVKIVDNRCIINLEMNNGIEDTSLQRNILMILMFLQ